MQVKKIITDGRRKVTEKQVLEMREASARGESQASLARRFNISPVTVHHILHRETWKHI